MMPIEFGDLRLYSLDEVAQKFKKQDTSRSGVTVVTLRSYIRQGLKARKIGGQFYTTEESLRQFVESGPAQDKE